MTVYILYSQKLGRYYTGIAANLEERLARHNNGASISTKNGIPWKVVWYVEVENRSAASRLERKIKGRGAKRFLEDNTGAEKHTFR